MRELSLFTGAGGGLLASRLLGWSTVCGVELDEYARAVLHARQRDGMLEHFPVWDDVRTFDGEPWRGAVDVISGGFPCQDISAAGKGAGIDGERSGLWSEFARIIGEVGPRFVFVENSPNLVTRGLGRVLGDLASLGYDAEWCVLGADDLGAPHLRKRIWILAHFADADRESIGVEQGRQPGPSGTGTTYAGRDGLAGHVAASGRQRLEGPEQDEPDERKRARARGGGRTLADPSIERLEAGRTIACDRGRNVADANGERCEGIGQSEHSRLEGARRGEPDGRGPDRRLDGPGTWPAWPPEPDVGRVVLDGLAPRVDRAQSLGPEPVPRMAWAAFEQPKHRGKRLRAIGAGQVPRVAAAAFELLRARGGW